MQAVKADQGQWQHGHLQQDEIKPKLRELYVVPSLLRELGSETQKLQEGHL